MFSSAGGLYAKKLGNEMDNIHVTNDSCVNVTTTVNGELDVTRVENSGDELETGLQRGLQWATSTSPSMAGYM